MEYLIVLMYYFFTGVCYSCIILNINSYNPILMQTFKLNTEGLTKRLLLRSLPSILIIVIVVTVR